MPSRKNLTGNWASIGGGDPEICNSCGKPYKQWPGDDCQFKIFHEPFVVARGGSQPKRVSKAPEIPQQPVVAPPKAAEPTITEPAKELTPAQEEYVSFLKTRLTQLYNELNTAKRSSGTKREEGVIQSAIDFMESKLEEIEPRRESVKRTPSIREIPVRKEPVSSPAYTPGRSYRDYDQGRDDPTYRGGKGALPSNPKYMGFSKSRNAARNSRNRAIGKTVVAILLIIIVGLAVYENQGLVRKGFSDAGTYLSAIGPIKNAVTGAVSSAEAGVKSLTPPPPPPVNSAWAAEFFSDLNQNRSSVGSFALLPCQILDNYAQLRFNTMNTGTNWEISHYGATADFHSFFVSAGAISEEEEYFFPDGYEPAAYTEQIKTTASVHWSGLIDNAYGYYGYYLGQGPIVEWEASGGQTCGPTEILGEGINMTQDGGSCTVNIVHGTWFIIEVANTCPSGA